MNWTSIKTFFSGWTLGWWLYAAAAIGGGAIAGYIVHRMDEATITALKLSDAVALNEAVTAMAKAQAAADAVVLTAAVDEAKAQQHIVTVTNTITKEIPRYVTVKQDAVVCVTVGLVRVLNAAALQADPATLALAAGQSDDDCTDTSASALAANITENYGAFAGNAEQLNALIAVVNKLHAPTP